MTSQSQIEDEILAQRLQEEGKVFGLLLYLTPNGSSQSMRNSADMSSFARIKLWQGSMIDSFILVAYFVQTNVSNNQSIRYSGWTVGKS